MFQHVFQRIFQRKICHCPPNVRPSVSYDTDIKGNKIVETAEKFLDLDHPMVSSTNRKCQVIFSSITSSCGLNDLKFGMYINQGNKNPLRPETCGKSSSFMLDMPKMRNLGYIHVPVVQSSRNLAEIFIQTIEAQQDLKFVESPVPSCWTCWTSKK